MTLDEVREAANAIIATLKPADFAGEAINWGDLYCVEARFWTNDAHDHGVTVIVEEAAPGECPKLCAAIRSGLACLQTGQLGQLEVLTRCEVGFLVEVLTQW